MPQPHWRRSYPLSMRMVVQMVSSWERRNLAGCQAQLSKKQGQGPTEVFALILTGCITSTQSPKPSGLAPQQGSKQNISGAPPSSNKDCMTWSAYPWQATCPSHPSYFLLSQPRNVSLSLWSHEACPFQGGEPPHILGLAPGPGTSLVFLMMDTLQAWPDSSTSTPSCSLTSPRLSSPHSGWPVALHPGYEPTEHAGLQLRSLVRLPPFPLAAISAPTHPMLPMSFASPSQLPCNTCQPCPQLFHLEGLTLTFWNTHLLGMHYYPLMQALPCKSCQLGLSFTRLIWAFPLHDKDHL